MTSQGIDTMARGYVFVQFSSTEKAEQFRLAASTNPIITNGREVNVEQIEVASARALLQSPTSLTATYESSAELKAALEPFKPLFKTSSSLISSYTTEVHA